jgi:hypothetical protein
MKNRTTSVSVVRRNYYEAASYRRWAARQIGPRRVGGIYRSGGSGDVYQVLDIQPGPRPSWPIWQITVQYLDISEARTHCTAWNERHDQVVAEPGPAALTVWADAALTRPASTGELMEQRHVLDEAAHPHLVEAFRRLATV